MNTILRIPEEIVFVLYHANITKVYMNFQQYHINTQDESLSYAKIFERKPLPGPTPNQPPFAIAISACDC